MEILLTYLLIGCFACAQINQFKSTKNCKQRDGVNRDITNLLKCNAAADVETKKSKNIKLNFKKYLADILKINNLAELAKLLVKDSRLIYITEAHPEVTTKEFLKDTLKFFKDQGVTHLGMEMFNSNRQKDIDQYQGRGSESDVKRIKELLDNEWGWMPVTEYYFDVIKLANSLGIKIVAIDGRHLYPVEANKKEAEREAHIAKNIKKVLGEDNQNKMVTLVGSKHGYREGKVSTPIMSRDVLDKEGVSSLSYKVYFSGESGYSTNFYGTTNSGGKILVELIRDYVESYDFDTLYSFLKTEGDPQYSFDGILFLESLSKRWRQE